MANTYGYTTEHLGPGADEDDLLALNAAIARVRPRFATDKAAADWVWDQLPLSLIHI